MNHENHCNWKPLMSRHFICPLQAEGNFKNLSASLPDLKAYLAVRENCGLYEQVRQAGGIGIPFFELEDGTRTMDLDEVLAKL